MLKTVRNPAGKMILIVSCFLLFMVVAGCNLASSQPSPAYGAKVRYRLNQPLAFPDLTLEFSGERKVDASPQYPRGFTYYDFKVRQDSREQTISWSAGTGDIGPTSFEVAGQSYLLELAMSDRLGLLAEDELVLWQK